VNSARWVLHNDLFQQLNELSETLSVKYRVNEAASANIQSAERTFLLVGARRRNPDLLAALHPHGPYGRKKMDVAFIFVDYMIPGCWGAEDLGDNIHLGLCPRIKSWSCCMPGTVVPKSQRLEKVINRGRFDCNAVCPEVGAQLSSCPSAKTIRKFCRIRANVLLDRGLDGRRNLRRPPAARLVIETVCATYCLVQTRTTAKGTADRILDSKRDRRVSVCIKERNA